MARYVRKSRLGGFSSWHCKETKEFKELLGNVKCGRKTAKAQIRVSKYAWSKEDFHLVKIYVLPAEFEKDLQRLVDSSDGTLELHPCPNTKYVKVFQHLRDWELDPRDREGSTDAN